VSADPAGQEYFEDRPRRGGALRPPGSTAARWLLILALCVVLYVARDLLLPLVVAVLVSLLLRPPVRWLRRLWLPDAVGAVVVLGVLLGAVGYAGAFVVEPATSWIERAPVEVRRLERKLDKMRRPVQKVTEATEAIEGITGGGDRRQQEVRVQEPSLSDYLVAGTGRLMAGAAVTLALTFFLLAGGDEIPRRLGRAFRGNVAAMVAALEVQVSRYLLTIALINALLGLAIGFALWALGMPNPILWGVMAMLLNYIPYLGAATGVVVVTAVGLLTFDDAGQALLVGGVYLLLTGLEGYLLTPAVLGRSLALNPVAIFLGLIFWGWLWGAAGALLAVPLLMCLRIAAEQLPGMRPLRELLAG
jgi:predicted PurR-regulated permease PerM